MDKEKPLSVSVVIPVFNEEKYIAKCLDSVIANDYSKDDMEVIVVDGGSSDGTVPIVRRYIEKYEFIKMADNPNRTPPYALNIGIRQAMGEYIVRLDAHTSYPKDYITKLIHWSRKLNAENVGGVCKTKVLSDTKKANGIAKALSHRLGVGNSLFRIGVKEPTEVDTVPFGCYRREIFNRLGLFDERLARNQDIEFNKRLLRMGGKIYLVPEIECSYYARENYCGFARNNYSNGLWNILTVYYTRTFSSLSLRHYIPLLFILSLFLPLLLSVFDLRFVFISLFSFMAYNSLILNAAIRLSDKSTNPLRIAIAFYILHFAYGSGSLMALLKIPFLFIRSRLKKHKSLETGPRP